MCVLLKTAFANDCLLPAGISRQSKPGMGDLHACCNRIVQLPQLHRHVIVDDLVRKDVHCHARMLAFNSSL